MKKILTLSLAIALAFALAVPALAITGDLTQDPTNPKTAPIAMDLQLFTAPEALGAGALSLSNVASNKMYVVNEVAFWGIALSYAVDDDEHDLTMKPSDYEYSDLIISCDAFALKDIAGSHAYEKEGNKKVVRRDKDLERPTLNSKGELVMQIPDSYWGKDFDLYFFGQGIVASKGVLKATLVKNSKKSWEDGLQIYKADGSLLYTVTDNGAGFTVYKGATDSSEYVVFSTDDNDEVTGIYVVDREVTYKNPIGGGGTIVTAIGGATSGSQYEADKKLYEGVMSFFGFNYDAEGRLLAKHFESKSNGLNLKDEVAINLYTGSIVLPDGPSVPKTGDSASLMGFVMIGLAIAAAFVVAAKKVRA
ncbi:MAG: hypothetical protein BWY11_00137 [Firmicutes bacterium ADurb.Bin182]|nr:MAG: hypothetical protein BWY11_00137 [Firmicutes bacterium ADurb.Bin182]